MIQLAISSLEIRVGNKTLDPEKLDSGTPDSFNMVYDALEGFLLEMFSKARLSVYTMEVTGIEMVNETITSTVEVSIRNFTIPNSQLNETLLQSFETTLYRTQYGNIFGGLESSLKFIESSNVNQGSSTPKNLAILLQSTPYFISLVIFVICHFYL